MNLDAEQRDRFVHYARLIAQTNLRINLTGMKDPTEILRNLVVDSLTVLMAIPELVEASEANHRRVHLADVGSGAGIPGIPLKVACPSWQVTLVESIGKKTRFLRHAIAELGLRDAIVLGQRAEEVGAMPEWRDRADVCVARAVAPLASLVELCGPLVRVGGYLVFPKGAGVSEELARSAEAQSRLSIGEAEILLLAAESFGDPTRTLVRMKKLGPTPPGYPRRVGLAQSRPLMVERSGTGHA